MLPELHREANRRALTASLCVGTMKKEKEEEKVGRLLFRVSILRKRPSETHELEMKVINFSAHLT